MTNSMNSLELNKSSMTAQPKKKKKKASSLERKKARAGWIFVLPFIIGLAVVYLPIIWTSLKLSFHQMVVQQGGGYELEWVGLANYQEAWFGGSNFIETLILGIKNLAFEIPAIIIFSISIREIIIFISHKGNLTYLNIFEFIYLTFLTS